ncbi:PorP/SprF family type IX secretion system membrane protein [Mucilaginibacter sp.]
MKFGKSIIFFTVMILAVLNGFSQDHLYSQFFNAPVYLNPALNGQFEGDFRANFIYRTQYTTSGSPSTYFTASMDYNIPQFGGGIGIIFNRSSEGNDFLNTNNIAGIYSYSVGNDDYILSFGLQAGISNQSIDYSKLVFDDQINPTIGIIPGTSSSADALAFNNKYYFDTGAGINLVVGNFMAGAAFQHLNGPNDSFTGTPVKLPLRSTAYVTYRLDLNSSDNMDEDDKSYVIPSVVFYKQAQSQSTSAGVEYKHRSVSAGLWYRSGGQSGPSAVVVSLIFDLFVNKETREKFRLGVSHDAPVSGINYGGTSGSSEGSINYQTINPNRADAAPKFEGATHCYEFY